MVLMNQIHQIQQISVVSEPTCNRGVVVEDSVSSSSYHCPMFLTYAALQGVCVNLRVSVCVCKRERKRECV